MNTRMVGKYLGYLLWAEAVFMLPSVLVALLYAEQRAALSLLVAAGLCALLGLVLFLPGRHSSQTIYAREGFVIAGVGWIFVSLLGALPFVLSGEIPSLIDAFFESASGFTTTGASILRNVEAMGKGLLFWRSFTHWLGGIGVLAFILAIVRSRAGAGFGLHLLRAETTGPQVDKLTPHIHQSVRALFAVYAGLSLLNLICLLVGGMPVFDALCTMFGTAGTGGFGIKNDSMASYSGYLQTVTTVFMAVFGVNFSLYHLLLHREWRAVLRDEELRLYLGILLGFIALICLNLVLNGGPAGESLHHTAFTVSSVMTTTGYATVDFNLWPEFSRTMLLILMIFGAMAGSTGGGFKIARLLIFIKNTRVGMHRLLHPNSVKALTINGRRLDNEVVQRTNLFLVVYCAILLLVFALVSLDGQSTETNLSAVLSCLNNIGPGLGAVGPVSNYAGYSAFSKLVLAITMLVGRLELFPILILAIPSTWRRKA